MQTAVRTPWDLGDDYEASLSDQARRARGAWYTPSDVARTLVAAAIPDPAHHDGLVVDPACGGGAFLLAAADHLADAGHGVADVMAMLWGADIDPAAVDVARAALGRWSAQRGHPTPPSNLHVGDALGELELPEAAVVVGNPPFLGQLRTDTAMSAATRAGLRARFGPAVRPYTDPAWLFLLHAVQATRAGGSVALIQPRSVLASRDAGPIRAGIDAIARLDDVWVGDGGEFDAAVDVCAPIIRRPASGPAPHGFDNDWLGPLADALGIPRVTVTGTRTLGDLASVSAGFRDEYYGVAAAVTEGGAGPELVTVGAIEPLRLHLGARRIAKQRWRAPRVDLDRVAGERARRWVDAQLTPKVVVATQTRVVEAAVDEAGTWVASTPAIAVIPAEPGMVWHVAAALHAPSITAWLARRTAGTGLSPEAMRLSSGLIGLVPLPEPGPRWDRAAELAHAVAAGTASIAELGPVADAAYGIDRPDVVAWWRSRLPRTRPIE